MIYNELLYGNEAIQPIPETDVLGIMDTEYKATFMRKYIAYFNYAPDGLAERFPLCSLETYERIYWKYRNWKPKEGKKWDLHNDKESIVFPRYSIVDCAEMPKLWGRDKVFKKFVSDNAVRFIIFINYKEKTAFPRSGGASGVLFATRNEG